MSKTLLGLLLLSTAFSGRAFAGDLDDIRARLDAIEKENVAIRKENAALLENKRLREQNGKLKSVVGTTAVSPPVSTEAAVASTPAAATPPATSNSSFEPMRTIRTSIGAIFDDAKEEKKDPFAAYAADLPVAYKAAPPEHGQLRIWAEGGAIWTGGDPVQQNFSITNFSDPLSALVGNNRVGQFDLTPKVGWDAATGFDYRFAGSPWHVSMQFRYGEGGKTSGVAASAGSFDLASLLALLGGAGGGGIFGAAGGTFGGSETFTANYKETHWLTDFAVGRDVTSGRDAMQVKGGIRIAEYVDNLNTSDAKNTFLTFNPAIPSGIVGVPDISSISVNTSTLNQTRDSFLGAGPKVGIEGSVPFAGKWSLDYLADAAILFGTERTSTTTTLNSSISPPILVLPGGGGLLGGVGANSITTATAQRFSSVFSGDVQVGVGYWITPYMKLAASYRLDAMIHVQNTDAAGVTTFTPDRYWHGPRVTLTGQFDSM
jgi:Legionella pneumophila major outer membrane protein precursor